MPRGLPSGIYWNSHPSWHVSCGHSLKKKLMAAKIRMLKLLQEIRGFADIANRRPPPRSPGLLLTQIRSHVIQATLPKRRLSVKMDVQDHLDLPRPVKINHVRQNPAPRATVSAP